MDPGQIANRDRFSKRWAGVLGSHTPVLERFDEATWHRLARTPPP